MIQSYQVKLPVFEGPFDLLFHLIEEQKINIYDIPIAAITAQYFDYLHMMEILDIEVAGSFLIMAATLLEIKSKMLLPKEQPTASDFMVEEGEENTPPIESDARADLVEKLLEYKRFKLLALQLRELERKNSRIYARGMTGEFSPEEILQIQIKPHDLMNLYRNLLLRRLRPPIHRVVLDRLSVEEKILEIRRMLAERRAAITFHELLKNPTDRAETVLSLMAILEMAKSGEITIKQPGNFKPVTICWRAHSEISSENAVQISNASDQLLAEHSHRQSAEKISQELNSSDRTDFTNSRDDTP